MVSSSRSHHFRDDISSGRFFDRLAVGPNMRTEVRVRTEQNSVRSAGYDGHRDSGGPAVRSDREGRWQGMEGPAAKSVLNAVAPTREALLAGAFAPGLRRRPGRGSVWSAAGLTPLPGRAPALRWFSALVAGIAVATWRPQNHSFPGRRVRAERYGTIAPSGPPGTVEIAVRPGRFSAVSGAQPRAQTDRY
jgi:hypothetical protein